MSVKATLFEIPPYIYDQVASGISAADLIANANTDYWIDAGWYDYHEIFQLSGPPLSMAMSGDSLHPESPHSFEEYCAGGHNHYLGFASPLLVRQIADALLEIPTSLYEGWTRERWPTSKERCSVTFFPDLKRAYSEAASHGNAIEIAIQ